MDDAAQKELNRLSAAYMERFRYRDGPLYEEAPWIAARVGWAEGYIKGRSLNEDRLATYERLLRDVLDLPSIADGHPRGIKTLIREALK
jgi:hypothetical protein